MTMTIASPASPAPPGTAAETPPADERGRWRITWMALADLIVPREFYQRDYRPSRIKRMAARFNPDQLDPLVITRSGHITDGGHRYEMLRQIGWTHAPCRTIAISGIQDEARTYVEANSERKGLGSLETFRGKVVGRDPEILAMVALAGRAGFQVATTGTHRPDAIVAVETLTWLYRLGDPDTIYLATLRILHGAWPHNAEARSSIAIRGTGLFVRAYSNDFDEGHLMKRLGRTSAVTLIREAKMRAQIVRCLPAQAFALLLLSNYNRDLRTNKLPDRLSI